MRFLEEEWEAATAALRDLHVTTNRLCGEAAHGRVASCSMPTPQTGLFLLRPNGQLSSAVDIRPRGSVVQAKSGPSLDILHSFAAVACPVWGGGGRGRRTIV